MNKFFYGRLAFINLNKNRSTYVPYLLAGVGIVFMYFLLSALAGNPGLKNMPASESLKSLFLVGVGVTKIFSIIFILYANSFLMKRRKKEIGLYSILGLEKRHISYVMFYEMLYTAFAAIAGGILLGAVFGRLCFLILMKFIHVSPDSRFIVTKEAAGDCVLFFVLLYLVTFVVNYIQVKTNQPMSLLRDEKAGEKEPKSSVLILLIGIGGLGGGYYISQTAGSVLNSIPYFFTAVFCVIIGTYALFTSGSIFLLKWLKKRKGIYYKPNNFIAISNMLYRMKKNAAGLAGICIVSTMLLVVISTTTAMTKGKAQMLVDRNPYELSLVVDMDKEQSAKEKSILSLLEKTAREQHVRITEQRSWYAANMTCYLEDGVLKPASGHVYEMNLSQPELADVFLITLEDYNRLNGTREELAEGEALLFSRTGAYGRPEININGHRFRIRKELADFEAVGGKKKELPYPVYDLVVKDRETRNAVFEDWAKERRKEGFEDAIGLQIHANLEGLQISKRETAAVFRKGLRDMEGLQGTSFQLASRTEYSDDWDSLYGGLMFLGVSLSALFLIAMVLIIYFKQVSEGYEDRTRFEVMQKVGMGYGEVRRAINRQIRMCFALPVAGALLHIGFAFKTLHMMLLMLGFADKAILLRCMLATAAIYMILYFFVYQVTSRVYERIIKR